MNGRDAEYVLGHSDAEHERLIPQAARIAPLTERFFVEAGIGPGQRVLDLGSGVGDVAMLAARLVGPSGAVVGVERDPRAIARARARASEAGLDHLNFVESDVARISSSEPFDAAVGRFILQFLPDPVGALRVVSRLVRPGGVLAFLEPSWVPFLQLCPDLPLWSAGTSLIHEHARRAGVNTQMGLALHRIFQEAGLPAPNMHMEVPLGADSEFTRWVSDVICGHKEQYQRLNLSLEPLGDLDTLAQRLQEEVTSSRTVVPWLGLVGASARKPSD